MKISEIDKNFSSESSLNKQNIVFYDPRREPFEIYGLYKPESGEYKRLPDEVAKATNAGVSELYRHTSGGRINFATDSPYVALNVKLPKKEIMPHMPLTGMAGFDVYTNEGGGFKFHSAIIPRIDAKGCYENISKDFGGRKMREILLHFPLYIGVEKVYVGLDGDSEIKKAPPYKNVPPIVFYGSSITQGGCASRPGNNYPAIVSRMTGIDFICLGFSGSAKGEKAICDYIASLDMSLFVMDYDHNAPNAEYLEKTHKPFFETIRNAKPSLPIIIMSAPDTDIDTENKKKRRDVCLKTYLDAVAAGDKNVYFIDGFKIFDGPHRDACTVDGCHPNDLGFSRMADAVINTMPLI